MPQVAPKSPLTPYQRQAQIIARALTDLCELRGLDADEQALLLLITGADLTTKRLSDDVRAAYQRLQ
jgi:hypothetical protein